MDFARNPGCWAIWLLGKSGDSHYCLLHSLARYRYPGRWPGLGKRMALRATCIDHCGSALYVRYKTAGSLRHVCNASVNVPAMLSSRYVRLSERF